MPPVEDKPYYLQKNLDIKIGAPSTAQQAAATHADKKPDAKEESEEESEEEESDEEE